MAIEDRNGPSVASTLREESQVEITEWSALVIKPIQRSLLLEFDCFVLDRTNVAPPVYLSKCPLEMGMARRSAVALLCRAKRESGYGYTCDHEFDRGRVGLVLALSTCWVEYSLYCGPVERRSPRGWLADYEIPQLLSILLLDRVLWGWNRICCL
ncbi:hypothetical protein CPB86DRAFT_281371 [Serendipita vermifera]|nr:hypothetical protein CPB86DRAFT_281371 [Serendipita vermifera]